jgi:hypothetical protein
MIPSLAAARLRHRRGAVALIVLGLAIAIGGLLGARVAILHARDAELRVAIRSLAPGAATVRVGLFESSGNGNATLGFIPAPGPLRASRPLIPTGPASGSCAAA